MAINKPTIVIAGCGPGGADYLTEAVRKEIVKAEVLVGAARLLDLFPKTRAVRIPAGADIESILAKIAERRHKRVVVLVTGDPGICSLATPLIRRFGRKACKVIPGISAVQAAFASIGADWLNARIINAHNDIPRLDPKHLKRIDKLAVLTGNKLAVEPLLEMAQSLGRGYLIFACKKLTLPDESVQKIGIADLRRALECPQTILLFIKREALK